MNKQTKLFTIFILSIILSLSFYTIVQATPKIIAPKGKGLPYFVDDTGKRVTINKMVDSYVNVRQNSRVDLFRILPKAVKPFSLSPADKDYYFPVKWNIVEIDTTKLKEYKISGKVTGYPKSAYITVAVKPIPLAKNIQKISPMYIGVRQGNSFQLPKTAKAHMKNLSHYQIQDEDFSVKWNVSKIDTKKIGKYTLKGTVSGYSPKVDLVVDVVPFGVENVDANSLMITDESEESLISSSKLAEKAGISIANSSLAYDSNYTFDEHMNKLASFFNQCQTTLDPKSGYWDISGQNTQPSIKTSPGKITQATKNNYGGQYTGKTVITTSSWRNSIEANNTQNINLNLYLAVYKYFLGDKAGEDLWGLLDNAYVDHQVLNSKFGWKEKKLGTCRNYLGVSGCTMYEETHTSGTKILWIDAPKGMEGFDIVVINHGE